MSTYFVFLIKSNGEQLPGCTDIKISLISVFESSLFRAFLMICIGYTSIRSVKEGESFKSYCKAIGHASHLQCVFFLHFFVSYMQALS